MNNNTFDISTVRLMPFAMCLERVAPMPTRNLQSPNMKENVVFTDQKWQKHKGKSGAEETLFVNVNLPSKKQVIWLNRSSTGRSKDRSCSFFLR